MCERVAADAGMRGWPGDAIQRSAANDAASGAWFQGQWLDMSSRRDERDLREELIRLRNEHRELDREISALEVAALADQLRIQRLKKRKLSIKDQIQNVEDRLRPDIIA